MSCETTSARNASPTDRCGAEAIDRSARWPLLLLFAAALMWLLTGAALAAVAAFKLVFPALLESCPAMTYGRLLPAAFGAVFYGFAVPAGFGVAFWLLARLGRTPLDNPALALAAAVLWNGGVKLGVVGILLGDAAGFLLFPFPRYALGLLALAMILFGLCALLTSRRRQPGAMFPSQYYLVASTFWLVWSFAAAVYLLVCVPQRGIMQVVVSTWAGNNLINLWLVPVSLAVAFYFLPRVLNKPLHSAPLAQTAFWMLAIFGAGGGFLFSQPLPRWLPSVSSVCEVMLLIAVAAVAVNVFQTIGGRWSEVLKSQTLTMIGAGLLAWFAAVIVQVMLTRPGSGETWQLTWLSQGRLMLAFFGLGVLPLLGAMAHIIPSLAGRVWPCALLPKVNVLGCVAGLVLIASGLLLAGFGQGSALASPHSAFLSSVSASRTGLLAAAVGALLFTLGCAAFVGNLALMAAQAVKSCRPCGRGTALSPVEARA